MSLKKNHPEPAFEFEQKLKAEITFVQTYIEPMVKTLKDSYTNSHGVIAEAVLTDIKTIMLKLKNSTVWTSTDNLFDSYQ